MTLHRRPQDAAVYVKNHFQMATPSQIFETLYLAPVPTELLYMVADGDELGLSVDRTSLPWNVMKPMSAGGLLTEDPYLSDRETRALELFDGFVPLLYLFEDDAVHGDLLIGYDVHCLRKGDTSIFGLEDGFGRDSKPEFLGTSLCAVLLEWAEDILRMARFQAQRRFGWSDDTNVAEELETVERLLAFQRSVKMA